MRTREAVDVGHVDPFPFFPQLRLLRVVEITLFDVGSLNPGGFQKAFKGSQHPDLERGIKLGTPQDFADLLLDQTDREPLPRIRDPDRLVVSIDAPFPPFTSIEILGVLSIRNPDGSYSTNQELPNVVLL